MNWDSTLRVTVGVHLSLSSTSLVVTALCLSLTCDDQKMEGEGRGRLQAMFLTTIFPPTSSDEQDFLFGFGR